MLTYNVQQEGTSHGDCVVGRGKLCAMESMMARFVVRQGSRGISRRISNARMWNMPQFQYPQQEFLQQTRSFSALGTTPLAGKPADPAKPRQGHGPFDTFRFVEELENSGMPREQAVALMDQVLLAISEANTDQIALVATQHDLHSLKAEMSEKVFSSTLRYDLSQRHLKELIQRDIMQVKADVRQEEKFDFAKLHDEISELEKRTISWRDTEGKRVSAISTEMAVMERRLMQVGITFIISMGAFLFGAARFLARHLEP